MICTLTLPFHSLRSISIISETIFPGERWAFLSLAFQRRSFREGFSDIDILRCFSSCPRGLVVAIVTFSSMKSGFRFPMPNGLKWSISVRRSMVIDVGGSGHSIIRVLVGRLDISCTQAICFHIASLNAHTLPVSIVNPAACLCPPYLTKYSLQWSRSSIRLHHSGDLQEPIDNSIPVVSTAILFSTETVSHLRLVSGWSCPFLITIVGLL